MSAMLLSIGVYATQASAAAPTTDKPAKHVRLNFISPQSRGEIWDISEPEQNITVATANGAVADAMTIRLDQDILVFCSNTDTCSATVNPQDYPNGRHRISVTSQLGNKTSTKLTMIRIHDEQDVRNRPPRMHLQSFTVNPTLETDMLIGTLQATDPNKDQLTYEILPDQSEAAPFSLDAATGELRLKGPEFLPQDDAPTQYSFRVVVRDQGGLSDIAAVVVRFKDTTADQPSDTDQIGAGNTSEASIPLTSVQGTFMTNDPEGTLILDLDVPNAVRYAYGENLGQTIPFLLNMSTGEITYRGSLYLPLDDTPVEYNFPVSAYDAAGNPVGETFVQITRVN